jgi:hypothetical protein
MKKIMFVCAVLFSLNVNAEIYREAKVCDDSNQLCFFWWPKLKEVSGWQQDMSHSYHYRMNTQVPTGFTFSNAEVVVYARAMYKPTVPDTKNIEQFIKKDKADFLSDYPSFSIRQTETLKDNKGRNFTSYQFKPSGKGNWEQIAYSEEIDGDQNEYYLVFVLSSRTETSYKESIDTFNKFVTSYE